MEEKAGGIKIMINKKTTSGVEPESQEYIDLIDDMLLDIDYAFAEPTLSSIREWAGKAGFLTDKQKKAICNIYDSGGRKNE